MARHAFLLGGTGQTGRLVARRLLARGWAVTLASRGRRPRPADVDAAFVEVDRDEDGALATALGEGVDSLVDFVGFEPAHAEQLLALRGRIGSVVFVSSASVYADDEGRSLDEATGPDDFPRLPIPIAERQRTVPPGDASYSTKKVAIERALLEQDAIPATVVRPGAIHGPGGTWSREWYFVKRVLDGRRYVILGNRGDARFHTTSAENLAELIAVAVQRPRRRVLNCGDPDPPTLLEIARAVAAALDHQWSEVLLPGHSERGGPGATPWSAPRPLVLDMTEAEIELGYRAVTSYPRAVGDTCRWLVEATAGKAWEEVLTGSAAHGAGWFDYDAEDALVRELAGSPP